MQVYCYPSFLKITKKAVRKDEIDFLIYRQIGPCRSGARNTPERSHGQRLQLLRVVSSAEHVTEPL